MINKELKKGHQTEFHTDFKSNSTKIIKNWIYFLNFLKPLVMGRTPYCRTPNELEHHFLNIAWTRTSSSIGDRTQTPYFWLRTIKHRTSNLIGLSINTFIKYENTHRSDLNIIFWTSNELEHVHLLAIEFYFWLQTIKHRTSNLIGLSLDLLNYSSNWLKHHFFEHRTNLNVFIYW